MAWAVRYRFYLGYANFWMNDKNAEIEKLRVVHFDTKRDEGWRRAADTGRSECSLAVERNTFLALHQVKTSFHFHGFLSRRFGSTMLKVEQRGR